MSVPSEFTSVISLKYASVVHIVHNVQAFELKFIHLNDLEVESIVGDITFMFRTSIVFLHFFLHSLRLVWKCLVKILPSLHYPR